MMRILHTILALTLTVAFAGRSLAQWTFFDLDDSVSGCCCDDEEDSAGDCCEDECDDFSCPMKIDPAAPGQGLRPADISVPGQPLLFEVSAPPAGNWQSGLERPPRFS